MKVITDALVAKAYTNSYYQKCPDKPGVEFYEWAIGGNRLTSAEISAWNLVTLAHLRLKKEEAFFTNALKGMQ